MPLFFPVIFPAATWAIGTVSTSRVCVTPTARLCPLLGSQGRSFPFQVVPEGPRVLRPFPGRSPMSLSGRWGRSDPRTRPLYYNGSPQEGKDPKHRHSKLL